MKNKRLGRPPAEPIPPRPHNPQEAVDKLKWHSLITIELVKKVEDHLHELKWHARKINELVKELEDNTNLEIKI